MNLVFPGALWGLVILVFLWFLGLFRLRPVRVVSPSVMLWMRIADRNPPIRALERPRFTLLFFLQSLAVASMVLGAAKPGLSTREREPIRLVVGIDNSASMETRDAAGTTRLTVAKQRVEHLLSTLRPSDEATLLWLCPQPVAKQNGRMAEIPATHDPLDVADLAQAVRARAGQDPRTVLMLVSDRRLPPMSSERRIEEILVGGPSDNIGIIDAEAHDDGRVFARFVNEGLPREVTLSLDCDGQTVLKRAWRVPEGLSVWTEKSSLGGVRAVMVSLDSSDNFPEDNKIGLYRIGGRELTVAYMGRDHPSLTRALSAGRGVCIDRVDRPARHDLMVWVGCEPVSLDRPCVVVMPERSFLGIEVRPAIAPGAVTLGEVPELLMGVREEEVIGIRARPLQAPVARTVFSAMGVPIAVLVERDPPVLVVALETSPEQWPASASYPIFWTNMVEYVRSRLGLGAHFEPIRCGHPGRMPHGVRGVEASSEVVPPPFIMGDRWIFHKVDEYRLRRDSGAETVRSSILNRLESSNRGEVRTMDFRNWREGQSRPGHKSLEVWFILAAAMGTIAAWWAGR